MPPAPPTFSTITCWPKTSERRGARTRPRASAPPPAANGTTMVTGRVGQFCALAIIAIMGSASTPASAAAMVVLGIVTSWFKFASSLLRLFCGRGRSLPGHAGGLDRGRPFLDLALDEFLQVPRRPALGRDQIAADLSQPRLHGGSCHRRDGRVMELLDDRRGSALGQEECQPVVGCEILEALLLRAGEIRQVGRAVLGQDRDPLHGLAFDLRN